MSIFRQRLPPHLTYTAGYFTGNPLESLLVESRPDCWRSLPKFHLLLEVIKINLCYFASSQQYWGRLSPGLWQNSYRHVGGYFWSHLQGVAVQECVCVCVSLCVSSYNKLPAVLVSNEIVLCQIWVAECAVDTGTPRLVITWSSSKFMENVDNYFPIDTA